MASLNFYRLRKSTVTSVLTGTILVSVDWLTSEHFQLLNCPAWCFVLLRMRYRCPFYHVPKKGVLVTYLELTKMFCSNHNAKGCHTRDRVYLVYNCSVSCKVPRLVFKLTTLSLVNRQIRFIFVYHSEFSGSRN